MKFQNILRPKDVAKILKRTVRTLQEWDKAGKFTALRDPITNRRYYTEEQVMEHLGQKNRKSDDIVIYARVSTKNQQDDMERQIEFLRQYANAKGYIVSEVISDIGSGLNYTRKKWNDLLRRIQDKEISKVIISHKDRFIRFGFDWFAQLAMSNGCAIEVVNNDTTSPQAELVQDLVSILHCFSCKIYGLRKYKNKIIKDKTIR